VEDLEKILQDHLQDVAREISIGIKALDALGNIPESEPVIRATLSSSALSSPAFVGRAL
jgi:hypothetical protein